MLQKKLVNSIEKKEGETKDVEGKLHAPPTICCSNIGRDILSRANSWRHFWTFPYPFGTVRQTSSSRIRGHGDLRVASWRKCVWAIFNLIILIVSLSYCYKLSVDEYLKITVQTSKNELYRINFFYHEGILRKF